jgi:hypothetical protein
MVFAVLRNKQLSFSPDIGNAGGAVSQLPALCLAAAALWLPAACFVSDRAKTGEICRGMTRSVTALGKFTVGRKT